MTLLDISDQLVRDLKPIRFAAPVAFVYNPLVYARAAHAQYLERYGLGPREIVLLGMNPGPWGMVQTGVPFGEVGIVRDWLRIDAAIERPHCEHPKRPVLGYGCTRSEVSGARLWGWARDRFKTPKRFFSRFFVANYCPLAFLEETGRNFTPDKLPSAQRRKLETACDRALRDTVELLQPKFVIGIGKFAERRAQVALEGVDVKIASILHPSPASPAANRDWVGKATAQLEQIGVLRARRSTGHGVPGH